MHHNYTPAKTSVIRLINWRAVIIDLLVPLVLIIAACMAWMDDSWYAAYLTPAAFIYVSIAAGRRRGIEGIFLIYCSMTSVVFIVIGSWQYFTGDVITTVIGDSPSMILAGVVLGLVSEVIRLNHRIDQIEKPKLSARSAEFPGIYRITCKPNGMSYIGQTSRPIHARWHDHRSDLNGGRHHNARMQYDWNLYRPEQFKWEVLEVVTNPAWLFDRERAWQDAGYDTTKRYNPPNPPHK